jgi:cardiolipin synthase
MDWQQLASAMQGYWPHLVLAISVLASVLSTIHIAMTKQDVKSAIGWVAVVIFSPLLGATFYLFAGINRIRQKRLSAQREMAKHELAVMERLVARDLTDYADPHLDALRKLGNNVCENELLNGNRVEILDSGDETYPAMLEAIASARQCVVLQSYIFDHDAIGVKIAQALIDANNRGVQVRVLIDAVGAKYSSPPITRLLKDSGIAVARFLPTAIGIRLVYANLRSHRKLLVVDGSLALAGGMNIRSGFMTAFAGDNRANDTHFKVTGPIARQLMNSFAHDWEFTTRESLPTAPWFEYPPQALSGDDVTPARVVPSGPDRTMGSNQSMILGALSVARHHVRIQSPYFLPDMVLMAALVTAARRGVTVDVLIPGHNNLKLVGAAMEAQLELLIKDGVRVWRTSGAFDHSKLLTIDHQWSYVGSSNIDPRSLRLNFELDLEVYSRALANHLSQRIDSKIAHGKLVTLAELQAVPFLVRLRNRLIWLVSPYL